MIIVTTNGTSICASGVDTTGSFQELLWFICMAWKYMKSNAGNNAEHKSTENFKWAIK